MSGDNYRCGFCQWAGSRVDEQRITYTRRVLRGGELVTERVTVIVCWRCGQEVRVP